MLKLNFINQALSRVGQPPVTDVDATKASRALHKQYPHSLAAVLSVAPWDCYKKYVTLEAELDEEDAVISPNDPSYSYQFKLPYDFCRLVEEDPTGIYYDRVSKLIYGNESTLSLWYVCMPYSGTWSEVTGYVEDGNWKDLTETAECFNDVYFYYSIDELVQLHMCKTQAYYITGDHNDTQVYEQLYSRLLTGQETLESQQKQDKYIEATEWIDVRR